MRSASRSYHPAVKGERGRIFASPNRWMRPNHSNELLPSRAPCALVDGWEHLGPVRIALPAPKRPQ